MLATNPPICFLSPNYGNYGPLVRRASFIVLGAHNLWLAFAKLFEWLLKALHSSLLSCEGQVFMKGMMRCLAPLEVPLRSPDSLPSDFSLKAVLALYLSSEKASLTACGLKLGDPATG